MNFDNVWLLNAIIFILSGGNTYCWGLALKSVGKPTLNLPFFLKLCFNPFFILALALALSVTFISYTILSTMGVARGRFFLSTSSIATIVTAVLFLGEHLTLKEGIGIVVVLAGIILVST